MARSHSCTSGRRFSAKPPVSGFGIGVSVQGLGPA